MMNLEKYLAVVKREHYYICMNFEEFYGGKEYKHYSELPRGKGLITYWLVSGKGRERILSENIKSDPKISRLRALFEECDRILRG